MEAADEDVGQRCGVADRRAARTVSVISRETSRLKSSSSMTAQTQTAGSSVESTPSRMSQPWMGTGSPVRSSSVERIVAVSAVMGGRIEGEIRERKWSTRGPVGAAVVGRGACLVGGVVECRGRTRSVRNSVSGPFRAGPDWSDSLSPTSHQYKHLGRPCRSESPERRLNSGAELGHGAISTGCPRARSPETVERRWAGGGNRGARSRGIHHETLADADRELRPDLVPVQRRRPPTMLQAPQRQVDQLGRRDRSGSARAYAPPGARCCSGSRSRWSCRSPVGSSWDGAGPRGNPLPKLAFRSTATSPLAPTDSSLTLGVCAPGTSRGLGASPEELH